jgi:two-component system, response regulator YesN
VKKFIERNCYKKTTLADAANAVFLSPKYLSRVFKECAGCGFTDYRLGIKINKAKELLRTGGYNVDQVSEKLGYENTESFIRQFKKICKKTPAEFRKITRTKIRKK